MQGQGIEITAPHEAASLNLREQQERKDQWIGDVCGKVHLQTTETKHPADEHADRKVDTPQRETTDEDAQCDGRGRTQRCAALGAQFLKESLKSCGRRRGR